jgi:phosphatidate cytidylyltransferase
MQLTTLVFGLFYCGYLPSFWVRVRALAAPATITLNDTLQSVVATVSGSVPAPVTVQAGLLCTLLPVLCIVAADTFAYLGACRLSPPLTRTVPERVM